MLGVRCCGIMFRMTRGCREHELLWPAYVLLRRRNLPPPPPRGAVTLLRSHSQRTEELEPLSSESPALASHSLLRDDSETQSCLRTVCCQWSHRPEPFRLVKHAIHRPPSTYISPPRFSPPPLMYAQQGSLRLLNVGSLNPQRGKLSPSGKY